MGWDGMGSVGAGWDGTGQDMAGRDGTGWNGMGSVGMGWYGEGRSPPVGEGRPLHSTSVCGRAYEMPPTPSADP